MQDLLNEITELKEGQNKHTQDIKSLNDRYKELFDRLSSVDKLLKSLVNLSILKVYKRKFLNLN